MTLSEFKAWFEGFTESMDGPPSLKQWERIQARVKEISGVAVTERVYVDRYRSSWLDNNYYVGTSLRTCRADAQNLPGLVGDVVCSTATLAAQPQNAMIGGTEIGANGYMARFDRDAHPPAFDSHSAMNALGKADAEALKAA